MALLFISPFTSASDISNIRWGVEIWKGFTDEDGLYTQVMERVFETQGINLDIQVYPFARTLYLTRSGQLDIAGGLPLHAAEKGDYTIAKYPIAVSRFNIFYNKNKFNSISNINSIRGMKLVSTHLAGATIGLREDEYHVVNTRKQAINLVLRGRFDIYLDEEKVLKNTIEEYQEKFTLDNYANQLINITGIYMVATNNKRGREIIDIFNKGMERLAKSGELASLYENLDFIVPDINQ